MKTCLAIPARLHSQRIQHKLLQKIAGKSVLAHTLETAKACSFFDDIVVVTDNDILAGIAKEFAIRTHMITEACRNGSERIAKTLDVIDADIIVNLQADEMEASPQLLNEILAESLDGAQIVSAMYPISSWQEAQDPNRVKVVCNHNNEALYFSRAPIPYAFKNPQQYYGYGHIGIYSYQRDVLRTIANHPPCKMEQLESLEQLRALFLGYTIKMITSSMITSVNSTDDIQKLREKHGY